MNLYYSDIDSLEQVSPDNPIIDHKSSYKDVPDQDIQLLGGSLVQQKYQI